MLELKDHGFTDGKVHIAHCDNPEAAKRLKLMIHAVFAAHRWMSPNAAACAATTLSRAA